MTDERWTVLLAPTSPGAAATPDGTFRSQTEAEEYVATLPKDQQARAHVIRTDEGATAE